MVPTITRLGHHFFLLNWTIVFRFSFGLAHSNESANQSCGEKNIFHFDPRCCGATIALAVTDLALFRHSVRRSWAKNLSGQANRKHGRLRLTRPIAL